VPRRGCDCRCTAALVRPLGPRLCCPVPARRSSNPPLKAPVSTATHAACASLGGSPATRRRPGATPVINRPEGEETRNAHSARARRQYVASEPVCAGSPRDVTDAICPPTTPTGDRAQLVVSSSLMPLRARATERQSTLGADSMRRVTSAAAELMGAGALPPKPFNYAFLHPISPTRRRRMSDEDGPRLPLPKRRHSSQSRGQTDTRLISRIA
jgi:hypothetical protein